MEIPYDLTLIPVSADPIAPTVFTMPFPFPYESTKETPWIYDSIVYIHGKKIEDEPLESKETNANITGSRHITRSGRVFAPIPPLNDNSGASGKDKEKQVGNNNQGHNSTQKATPASEVEEFLRII